jgi:hypothetical protein
VPLDGAAGIDGVVGADDEAGALAADVAAGVVPADVEPDELEHAAASNATGTKAVTVKMNRVLLATGEYSFIFRCTPKHAVASHTLVRASKGSGTISRRSSTALGLWAGVSRTGH